MIRRVHSIDLAFHHDRRTSTAAGRVLLVFAVLLCVGVLRWLADTRHAVDEMKQANLQAQQAQSRALVRPVPSSAERERAQRAAARYASIAGQLGVAWDELFRSLEQEQNANVTLLSIEPDATSGTILIGGEARTVDAMLDYSARLTSNPRFGGVFVKSHAVQTSQPQRPVRFQISARWFDPAKEAR